MTCGGVKKKKVVDNKGVKEDRGRFEREYWEMKRSLSARKGEKEDKKVNNITALEGSIFKSKNEKGGKRVSVRAKSEERKQKHLLKESKEFYKKDQFMRKRRSRFF